MVKKSDFIDAFKTKKKLIQELAEIRAQLTANAQVCQAQVQELTRIRSHQKRQSSNGPEARNSSDAKASDPCGQARSADPARHDIAVHRDLANDYRNLFREMRDGLVLHEIIYDATGRPADYRFLAVNPAFEKMTGLRSEQVLGCTVLELMQGDRCSWIQSCFSLSGEPTHFEYYASELGKYYEVSAYYPCPGQITCIFRDITERKKAEEALKQSEEKFRKIYESSIVGIFQSVPNGRFIDVNPAFAAMLGYDSPEDLLSCISDIGTQYYRYPEDRTRYRRMIEQNGYVENIEYQVKAKDGSIVTVNNSSRAHTGPDGEIVRYEGIVVDITERKKAEEALRKSEIALAQRNELAEARARQLQNLTVELIEAEERERRQFAQFLHDDLQQMIASAKMQVQAVADGLPPNPLLSSATQLLEESIAKSRSLSHELSPAVLHQCGLVAALRWLTGQMNEQFGMKVELETHTDLLLESSPFTIFLFRAVQELLFNIVKHAGVKSGSVLLESADRSLQIKVDDQGQGFDPEIMDNPSAKVGFGLMTIRERARYMGGQLLVRSAPGKGSCFTLTVPIHQAAASRQTKIEDQSCLAPGQPRMKAGSEVVRVLFADDHKLMRQGLIRLVANHPNILLVGEASNGREALEQTRRQKPDVVIMDVSMPEMDGIEATRHIKAELPDVRVIGLSMHSDAHIAQTMHEAGATAFLSKTTSSAELLKAIYEAAFDDRQPPVCEK
jgi:PAS domain S-box-containing protein